MKKKLAKEQKIHPLWETIKYGVRDTPIGFFLFILLSSSLAVVSLLSIFSIQYLVDSLHLDISKTTFWLTITTILMLGQGLLNAVYQYYSDSYFMQYICLILKKMNEKAGRLALIQFESPELFDIINASIQGVRNAIDSVLGLIQSVLYYCVFFIGVTGWLISLEPHLGILILLIFVPEIIAYILRKKYVEKMQWKTMGDVRRIQYYIGCLTDKKLFKETYHLCAQEFILDKYQKAVYKYQKEKWKAENKSQWIIFGSKFLTTLGIVICLAILFHSVQSKELSLGEFTAVFYSLLRLIDMMGGMIKSFGEVIENVGLSTRLYTFLNLPEETKGEKDIGEFEQVEVQNLHFRYPYAKEEALRGIDLTISRGEKIAIVGLNGSGKTTLSKILLGLYSPNVMDRHGKVTFRGNRGELDAVIDSTNPILSQASCVFQNYGCYKVSLRENVGISRPNEPMDDNIIQEHLHYVDFPVTEEYSLDKILSKEFGGIDLSGGQWQRIAIARMMYKSGNIIVLDEPTSAIDPLEEDYIYRRFFEYAKDKTAIVITHRLGCVKYADRILVMQDGRIVEMGSHKSLMKEGGLYAKMMREQSYWYKRNS